MSDNLGLITFLFRARSKPLDWCPAIRARDEIPPKHAARRNPGKGSVSILIAKAVLAALLGRVGSARYVVDQNGQVELAPTRPAFSHRPKQTHVCKHTHGRPPHGCGILSQWIWEESSRANKRIQPTAARSRRLMRGVRPRIVGIGHSRTKIMQTQSDFHNSKVEEKGGPKMKPRAIFSLILVMILAVGIIFTVWQLTRPTFSNVNQELEYLVTDTVKSSRQIKNCVLFVKKGDGSFSWSGAAGIASQNGQVPMTTDTPIYITSVTKLYTAVAIMKLYEQGALALDDPMAKYLPADLIRGIHVYQGHDYSNEITIEQLLGQTSGIADYYDEKAEDGKTMFELFVADPTRTWTVEETIARARDDMTANFKPGTAASYSDTNYQLLGKIIESVTGKPLEVVYDEFFFRPLELKHTWLVGRSKPQVTPSVAIADVFSNDRDITRIRSNGAYWADGGIVSTAEDAVSFLQALKEGKIICQDTLELMHTTWHRLPNMPFEYGYGTMKFEVPAFINWATKVPPVWGHTGSTGAFLYYAEDMDLYMAGTIDQTEDKVAPVMLMMKVMRAIARANTS